MQDANCPGPGNNGAGTSGDSRYAQTFIAVNSGQLTTATYFLTKTAGPDFRYDILPVSGGSPAATGALGSATIADAAIPNSTPDTPATGVFSPAVTVTAGQEYALAISRDGGPTWFMDGDTGNICPGSLFYSDTQTDPFGPGGAFDAIYSTNVEPLPPPAEDAPDTAPPDTQIAKGPKSKTNSKTATFEFVSTEAGSSFQCALNGGPFASCASPHPVKGKKGSNTFSVRATDAAGNTDATPATATWKVKKKKKK